MVGAQSIRGDDISVMVLVLETTLGVAVQITEGVVMLMNGDRSSVSKCQKAAIKVLAGAGVASEARLQSVSKLTCLLAAFSSLWAVGLRSSVSSWLSTGDSP